MNSLTYGTPCFEAFIMEYKLTKEDYRLIRQPVGNVVFDDELIQCLASTFLSGYSSALKHHKQFK